MERNRAGRRLGLSEIITKDRLHGFSGLLKVVVGDLREEVVHYVGSDIVMNFIENTKITVDS